MPARTKRNRIIRGLGKLVLWLLLFMATVVALLHLPVVQRQVTRSVAARLSARLNATVEIHAIRFALPGTVRIEDLHLWDPARKPVLSVRKFSLETNFMDLLRGRLAFDEIRLEGATGHLVRGGDSTNIDFILKAFTPKKPRNPSPRPVTLNASNIVLRDIAFRYTSEAEELDIDARADSLVIFGGELALNPAFIKAGDIRLQGGEVSIETSARAQVDEPATQAPTIGSFLPALGIGIEVASLTFTDCRFAHHTGQRMDPANGFDPDHLTLEGIGIRMTDISLGDDRWAASIRSGTARTAGFTLNELRTDVQVSKDRATLSGLEIRSGENELCAELTGRLDRPGKVPDLQVEIQAQLIPAALLGFVPDAVQPYLRHDQLAYLTLDGDLIRGTGHIRTLDMRTAASRLQAAGTVTGISGHAPVGWQDLTVRLLLGEDVRPLLAPVLSDVNLPPGVNVRLGSTGNPGSFSLDALATTTWGAVKAKGRVRPAGKDVGLDMQLSGDDVRLDKWLAFPWIGTTTFSANIQGSAGRHQDLTFSGQVDDIVLLDRSLQDVELSGWLGPDSLFARTVIRDPDYGAEIAGGISFEGPLRVNGTASLDNFNAGQLMRLDSTLILSGILSTVMDMDGDSLAGWLAGTHMKAQRGSAMYGVDSLDLRTSVSPAGSMVAYTAPDARVRVDANFDLRDAAKILPEWTRRMLDPAGRDQPPAGTRHLEGSVRLADSGLLGLLGLGLEEFNSADMTVTWDEAAQALALNAASGRMAGLGLTLDTLHAGAVLSIDTAFASVSSGDLIYAERSLGDLQVHLATGGDTVASQLSLVRDTLVLLGLELDILPTDSGALFFPLQLQALGQSYLTDRNHPVALENGKIILRDFNLRREDMHLRLDGDAESLEADVDHLDLTLLNPLLFPDSAVIRKGNLRGTFSFARGQRLDLRADIDSLYLHDSIPLALSVVAETKDQRAPFHVRLSGDENLVEVRGEYDLRSDSIDAALTLDIANPEMFAYLASDAVRNVHGAMAGNARVHGLLSRPRVDGYIRLLEAGLTTVRPRLTFHVPEDTITFNDSMVWVDGFKVLDGRGHPLTLSGKLTTPDYRTYSYTLRMDTDDYALVDIQDPGATPVRGLLALASAINVSGNENETYIQAEIDVLDTTALTLVAAQEELDMLKTEGIIEFVDPAYWQDTAAIARSQTYYDSIIASLPVFDLEARIRIDPGARLKIVTNAQSGDYLEASGSADLDLAIDRSGNPGLTGEYIVSKGIYRVSFYDLVRKDFTLVPGSRISWNGSPDNGDLDVRAVHTVASNSLGLIGHEIGENEQSIYKRALDYEVGIAIQGTLEKPVVSFTLDLPEADRTNYPVLANKLDRLKLPEFQSELNKQVFGLLVIGGFLPESSGSDISEGVMAVTAISNSVNALLASQLNRLAGQHIKGVSIDVGIQSYSDYSAPGGKTQTAMDFRVTKTIFNDRLSIEVGGDFDLNTEQSGAYQGDSYRGDMAIIYDLTGNGDKKLKMFNNETYDIVYQEIRNTGISLIFIREFNKGEKPARKGQ